MQIALTILLTLVCAATLPLVLFRTGALRVIRLWPALLYTAITLLLPDLYACWQGQVAVLCLVPFYLLLPKARMLPQIPQLVFYATLLLMTGGLVCTGLLCYLPLLLLALLYQQVLSIRSFLAMVIAIGCFVIWFYTLSWLCGAEGWGYSIPAMRSTPHAPIGIYSLILQVGLCCIGLYFIAKNLWRIGRSGQMRRFSILYSTTCIMLGMLLTVLPEGGEANTPQMVYAFCVISALYTTRNL